MDDGHTDEPTGALDPASLDAEAELGEPAGPDPWGGVGARRGPRQPAEGVRIINAEEAAAALEKGQATRRRPDDAPRFGDVPESPSGPRPSLRFPGADPAAVSKPPVAGPDPTVADPRVAEPLPPTAPSYEAPAAPAYEEFDPADDAAFWGEDAGLPAVGRVPAPASGRRTEPPAWPDDEPNPFWDDPPADLVRGTRASGAPGGGVPGVGGAGEQNVAEGTSSLPHWTEPPSGEVPRILPDADPPPPASADDFNAWSTLSTGPRWRDQHTDWDEADFKDEVLDDPGTRVGALRSGSPDDYDYGYDDVVEEPPPPPPEPTPTRAATRSMRPRRPAPSRGSPHPAPARRPQSGSAATPPRDMRSSVVTGVVALAVVLIAAFVGPAALVLLVTAVLVLAASELFQALRANGYRPATLLGLVGTAAMSGAVYWRDLDGAVLVMTLYMIASLLWYLFGATRARPVGNVAATVLGFVYVGFLGSFSALLLKYPANHGIGLLLGAVIATAAYDVGALFAGRWAGRTPLAPDISPGKTVEGMVGASFAALVACIVVVGNIHPWTTTRAFWLAIVVAGAAPLGDLCESMLKRDLGLKDMGALLPGHGGVLDRIDALLFVVPATFYLVRLLNFT